MDTAAPFRGAVARFFPFLGWATRLRADALRPDLEAGLVGAVLILPQAIALATLAGMPPEYGIYTSIIPVVVASLWGSSWHTLSGPNTAVCVLISSSVAPFAAIGTDHYIGYVLALTLMAGVIELTVGLARLGSVLDFISETVISAIVLAVALIIIVFAASSFLGVLSNIDEPFFVRLYQTVHDVGRANGYAVFVGTVTVASGLVVRRWWRRYALVIAVAIGTVAGYVVNLLYGPATTRLELLGYLSMSALPLSMPTFDLESMYVLKKLLGSAFSIAFLGLMQTIVIARSLAAKSGQHIDTNQEIVGQGLSNIVAPFFSSFAGSGSFNRSAAHFEAGARTPMAAVYASLMLAVLVLAGSSVIAIIPMPTVAGALILVGYGLIDVREVRQALRARQEAVIFVLTFGVALSLGLNSGVLTGLFLSLLIYLRYASTPNVSMEERVTRDGRTAHVLTIDGSVFFGSVRHIERVLARLGERDRHEDVLVIRTDHVTYLDVPGANLLAAEARRRRQRGGDLYVFVVRDGLLNVLQHSEFFKASGPDHVIHRDRDHPMKDMLFPARTATPARDRTGGGAGERDLATRLKATRLFSLLRRDQVQDLLAENPVRDVAARTTLIEPDEKTNSYLVLLAGELEVERRWSTADGRERQSTTIMTPDPDSGLAVLSAIGGGLRVRASTDARCLSIDGDALDALLAYRQMGDVTDDPQLQQRLALAARVGVFRHIPPENLVKALARMQRREVQGGETVVRRGDAGDCYYLVESGEAGVWNTDAFGDEAAGPPVVRLAPGEGFGEEALLQGTSRNATVMMTSPGTLLMLRKTDFDELIRPALVEDIAPADAVELVESCKARWLDCRYDLEFRDGRIPGARLLPLNELRERIHDLDPDVTWIVYSRGERRSRAAAFLLRERGIEVRVLKGGLRDWHYELETSPAPDSSHPNDHNRTDSTEKTS